MSGTDIAYAATRKRKSKTSSPSSESRNPYGPARLLGDVRRSQLNIGGRSEEEGAGTIRALGDVRYSHSVGPYVIPMRCPVLVQRMRQYTVRGTHVAYGRPSLLSAVRYSYSVMQYPVLRQRTVLRTLDYQERLTEKKTWSTPGA
eukprot:3887386-Rhodomonas_salina.1